MPRSARIWVATATAGGTLGGTTWLLAREAHRQWGLVAGPGPARLDEAVTLLATVLALVGCLWLATSTVAALLAHVPGLLGDRARGLAHVLAPAFTQRVAAVLVGAAVGGTLAPATALGLGSAPVDGAGGRPATSVSTEARPGPGFASTTRVSAGGATKAGVATAVAVPSEARQGAGPGFAPTTTSPATGGGGTGPGWTPSRPVVRPQASPDLLTSSPFASERGTVVVHRGDTLWGLVRSHLGPGASDAEVAQAWPRWYAANRGTIGPDPGLVLPGQVLRAPAPDSTWVP